MKRLSPPVLLVVAALALLLTGCSKHALPPIDRPDGSLAIAGFSSPQYSWQLLAGYVAPDKAEIGREVLEELDQQLVRTLTAHGVMAYMPPNKTRQCQEIITYRNEGNRISALKYWTDVGRCANVDWLFIPQVLSWKDRKLEDWASREGAAVALDFYYLDVAAGEIKVRRHFEDMQLPLTDDLGNAAKYFKRGGGWVPASRIAQEGIDMKLMEMGL